MMMTGRMMAEKKETENRKVLRMNIDGLSEKELEELARLVVRKIKIQIWQERDRIGRS